MNGIETPSLLSAGISFGILLGIFSISSLFEVVMVFIQRPGGRPEDRVQNPKFDYVIENPHRVSFALQLVRKFAAIGASVSAAYWWVIYFDLPPAEISTIDAIVSVGLVMIAVEFLAEAVPRVLATKYSDALSRLSFAPVYWLTVGFLPIYWLTHRWTSKLCALAGVSPLEAKRLMTEDEIKQLVDHAQQEGILEKTEQEMIRSIFNFSETVAREVMTPRSDAICIPFDKTISDVIRLIADQGHSRIPVFDGTIDRIVGFVYAKDLLPVVEVQREAPLQQFLRPVIFIPETQSIEIVLRELKRHKTHLGIVIDEFGSMSGLITLEDIIEEIVGDIQDEYDEDSMPDLVEVGDGRYLVDATMNMTDFSTKMDIAVPESEDYDTVGGFVLHHSGQLPAKGESVSFDGHQFVVVDVSDRRIRRLEFVRGETME